MEFNQKRKKTETGGQVESVLAELGRAVDASETDKARDILKAGAEAGIEAFLSNHPDRIDQMFDYARIMFRLERVEDACRWYRAVLNTEENFGAYNELGCIYQSQGRLSDAVSCLKKAVELRPHRTEMWANIGKALFEAGETEEGMAWLVRAVEQDPQNAAVHSVFLFCLHHLPELDTEDLFDYHRQWAEVHACRPFRTAFENNPDPERKLRIGYLSADFRRHSAAYFFESLLDGHDRGLYEIYAYGNVAWPDYFTDRIRGKCDRYRNIYGMTDAEADELMVNDGIDILVDLMGHTGENRMTLLARKPAPLIISYLAINTTAVPAVDYRFTDRYLNPPETQQYYTEQFIYLPDCHLCYRPVDFAPGMVSLPALRNGYVTFGSFNNHLKLHPHVLSVWSNILNRCEGARLVLKFGAGNDPFVRNRILGRFKKSGIDSERVTILGRKSPQEHLEMYNEIDIALDTWPFNGCTTTCEALWMGVPVVSMIGEDFVSREGLSILKKIGLDFFAVSEQEEYINRALALASNIDSLAGIRNSMRARIASSGLCYARGFTRGVEQAYREIWRKWCSEQL